MRWGVWAFVLFSLALLFLSATSFSSQEYAINDKQTGVSLKHQSTWEKLPLEQETTYYIGGYVKNKDAYTFFFAEINKGKKEFSVLCSETIKNAREEDVVCYDTIFEYGQLLTEKTDKYFIIVAVKEEQQETETAVTEEKTGTKTYFYGASRIASKNGEDVTYYHQDYLDSTRIQTGADAQKIFASRTEPFGSKAFEAGSAQHETAFYAGHMPDEDLVYMNARYYDAKTGRFTQLDPMQTDALRASAVSGSSSPYIYAENNPVAFVDPEGTKAYYAANIQQRASPLIDFMAKSSYSLKEVIESEYATRYVLVTDLLQSMRMHGTEPMTHEPTQAKLGYTDKWGIVFIRSGLNDIEFFHTLAHESMHAYALTQDRGGVFSRHADPFYAALDELRVELKMKYELGLAETFDADKWEKIGFDNKKFKHLQDLNEEMIQHYVSKMRDIVGRDDAEAYYQLLDEHIRTATEEGQEIY